MKKLFYYTLAAFSLFFIGNLDVSALEIKADEIGNRTYVIGSHMFTREKNESIGYDGKLTTERLMLASKTIEGNSLDDMIVYYKNPFGIWTNGITGEEIEVPESFNLEYKDTIELLGAPVIEQSGFGVSMEGAGIAFLVDDYHGAQEVEVYYATSEDGEYELLKTEKVADIPEIGISVSAPSGYHYYFKVKLVKTNNGITSRSEYSNILDVDSSFSRAPSISVLEYGSIDPETGANNTALGVDNFGGLVEIYYATSEDGEYSLYSEASFGDEVVGDFNVTIPLGSHYYFKARFVSADGKVVSEFSNVVNVDNNLKTPTITKEFAGAIVGEDHFLISLMSEDYVFGDSVEIYRSTSEDGEYELLETIAALDIPSYGISIKVYGGYHYYYKVRLVKTVDENTIYSDFSNIVEEDNSFVTPIVSVLDLGEYGSNEELNTAFSISSDIEDVGARGQVAVYRATIEDGEYVHVTTIESNTEGFYEYCVTIPLGSKYFYKVRYVGSDGESIVYSDFSNIIDIDNTIDVPTLSLVERSVNSNGEMELDIFSNSPQKYRADIVEIYRSTSEDGEYELLDSYEGINNDEVGNLIFNGYYDATVPLNAHYFYKIRVGINVGEDVIYSDYSNIVDYKYEFETPEMELFEVSEPDENGDVSATLFLDRMLGNVEIYYATSEDGEYSLLRTEYINPLTRAVVGGLARYFDVSVPVGNHYYFKVRFVGNDGENIVFSDFSNVVDVDNTNN